MFTEIDVFVCVVLMITTVIAFLRGFLKDFMGLLSYAGAAAVTLLFYPHAAEISGEVFKESAIMSVAAVILVFMVSLIFISIISAMILDNLRDFRLGALDRTLGVLYGLLKGFVIVSSLHYVVFVANQMDDPSWLKKGETFTLTKAGSDIIAVWLSKDKENPDEGEELLKDGPLKSEVEELIEQAPVLGEE